MDQNCTPLIAMLERFYRRNPAYFNIPGHRFERGIDDNLLSLTGPMVFRADVTETDGTDDLHAATGPILEAEQLAAGLYGTDQCHFLVNGTTCANEAMILSAVNPGEKILVPRNAHKSVYMGLVLSGAVPVWIGPEYDREFGIFGKVIPEKIEQELEKAPDIRAVFLVSPTYYGVSTDLEAAARICLRRGIPLLVDEAHGAHFHFHPDFPADASASGADLIAQSTHKTVGSMTQSSMLHRNGSLISEERLQDCLKLVQSSSPSYVLMASLDGARHRMAMHGRELWSRAVNLANELRRMLESVPGVRVLRNDDPCRVVFSMREPEVSGYDLQEALFQKDVTTEMADGRNVVAVVTPDNTEEEIARLADAVKEAAVHFSEKDLRCGEQSRAVQEMRLSGISAVLPPQMISPREAYFRRKRMIPAGEASGMTAGEMIAPYPPGIPLVYPGELLTEEILSFLRKCREHNIKVHGAADPALEKIRVLE